MPSSVAHRVLPSFPTRRSSDLGARLPAPLSPFPPAAAGGGPYPQPCGARGRGPGLGGRRPGSHPRGAWVEPRRSRRQAASLPVRRSEEHTSELQSQFHLVCRPPSPTASYPLSLHDALPILVRDYPRLYRLFRRLRPAVVHTRNLAALEAVVPAWAAGVPVRIHGEHGWNRADPDGKRRRYQYVRALYRPFVSRYVALSRHLEDYLERRVGVPSHRVSQIYNGVDTERFRPLQVRGRIDGCPFGHEDFVVGWVGRMDPVKDLPNLVRGFARATQRSASRLRLALVGDGPVRSAVEQLVQQEGLGERVWLAGERADIAEVMRGLDCFVLPSLGEGISNTILEAMATRLPVIATRVGGNAELIESGLTGLLVPPADSEALADAL